MINKLNLHSEGSGNIANEIFKQKEICFCYTLKLPEYAFQYALDAVSGKEKLPQGVKVKQFQGCQDANNLIHLTNGPEVIKHNNDQYIPGSGLGLKSLELTDSGQTFCQLEGIFDNNFFKPKHFSEIFQHTHITIYIAEKVNSEINNHFQNNKSWTLSKLISGEVSKIAYDNNSFQLTLATLASKLKNLITNKYSRTCRAKFGDSNCSINKQDHIVTRYVGDIKLSHRGTIIKFHSIIDQAGSLKVSHEQLKQLQRDLTFKPKHAMIYLTENKVKIVEVVSFSEISFSVKEKLETSFSLVSFLPHCTKTIESCANFKNSINFRGEPHIPKKENFRA